MHAGVAAQADQREKVRAGTAREAALGYKLERPGGDPLCRYISRPAVAEKRLSLTANGQVRYQLKTPYREAPSTSFSIGTAIRPIALGAQWLRQREEAGDWAWVSLRRRTAHPHNAEPR